MKYPARQIMPEHVEGRSSHEERGLKSEWVITQELLVCRSSHEERGLKYALQLILRKRPTSLLA